MQAEQMSLLLLNERCGLIRAFGPSAAAAQLEGSKKFLKV